MAWDYRGVHLGPVANGAGKYGSPAFKLAERNGKFHGTAFVLRIGVVHTDVHPLRKKRPGTVAGARIR